MSDFNNTVKIRDGINKCFRYIYETDDGDIYIVGKKFTETYVSSLVNFNRYVYLNNIDKKKLRLINSQSVSVQTVIDKMKSLVPLKHWIRIHPNEISL